MLITSINLVSEKDSQNKLLMVNKT